ncbi:MAG TPA: cellulase family glycosylhydrolase [Candidatus Binatia bacterium]
MHPIPSKERRAARASLRALALALVVSVFSACSDAPSAPRDDALRLPALHAEPDPVRGGRIVDAEGREVLLRGVNVNALAEYWAFGDFPTVFPFGEEDAEQIAAIGWSAVRLLLSWSRVEPEPGRYDEAYLDQVAVAVDLLARRGVYTILDFHQDAWGPTLAARPDEACPPDQQPAFGWDGAPGWATLDGGAPRCTIGGLRESSPAVVAAWDAFWRDDPGPDGVGIRTRYVAMVAHVAARFARDPAVAGYDLMNEPNAFLPDALAALADLYGDALAAIRAAERAAGGFPHLVLFEPSALWSAIGRGAPPDFPHDDDVVYAPHVYTGGFNGGPITREAFEIAREEAATFGGVPVLSGEWGSSPSRAENPDDPYFLVHQELQDEFRFGATLWTWRESCGDPHKAGDFRAGRIPEVWGEFEVDCRSNEIVGVRTALVEQLTRGYVRAAPGRLVSLRWQHATGVLEASGEGAAAGVELLSFYPARHGAPQTTSSGLSAIRTLAAPGGGLYVVARAEGGAWSLRVAPSASDTPG